MSGYDIPTYEPGVLFGSYVGRTPEVSDHDLPRPQ